MTITWEYLADCLRRELADYGGLLHLFELQQSSLFDRDAQAVLGLSAAIEKQVRNVAGCRERREQAVAAFAVQHDEPRTSTLRALLPHVTPDARPLLQALIDEVNALLHRVRRVSRHNHTLLSRAVEIHQDVLQQLRPSAFVKTYSPAGALSVCPAQPSTLSLAG